jgi:Lon-like ATP-dependent protease
MASAENACLVLQRNFGLPIRDHDIYINMPGGIPVDGPSAGLAMLAAVYSAYTGVPVDGKCAMTGEISLTGAVLPVGGIPAKVRAALEHGFTRVLIPAANSEGVVDERVTPVMNAEQALEWMLGEQTLPLPGIPQKNTLIAQQA